MKTKHLLVATGALFVALAVFGNQLGAQGQPPQGAPPMGPPGGGRSMAPPPDPTKPQRLEIAEGTKARYKVREQLAGISFPSDAVGTTESVTGVIVLNP